MMMILPLLFACALSPEPPAPPPDVAPRAHAADLRAALQEAQNAWSAGRRGEARNRVMSAYAQHFEPLEPQLRPAHGDEVLALEYEFGRLSRTLSAKGQPVAVNDAVQGLISRVEALVATLPAPLDGPVAEEPSVPTPVEVEVRPPQRQLTSYGDAAAD
jgi:hypothetical protein